MKTVLLTLTVFIFFFTTISAQKIIYVKQGAEGSGTSWENPLGSLDVALVTSKPDDQIWVAEGIYKPSLKVAEKNTKKKKTTDRDKTFVLRPSIKVYGGFAGYESSIEERIMGKHPSILSGDIGIENDSTDNVYHVVVCVYNTEETLLDGFTITGGNANNPNNQVVYKLKKIYGNAGGGIFCIESAINLNNITLQGNYGVYGGGIYNDSSLVTITKTTIKDNKAIYGGGVYNYKSLSTLSYVRINANMADNGKGYGDGGGIYNNLSTTTLTHGVVKENMAYWTGGGIFSINSLLISTHVTINRNRSTYGGGMTNSQSSTFLINTVVNGNAAKYGGGIYNHTAVPYMVNVAIKGNNSVTGGGIFNYNSSPALLNVVISGNVANKKDDMEGNGGGICNERSAMLFLNVTIGGNFATNHGGGIYNTAGSLSKLQNTIVWGNSTGVLNKLEQKRNNFIYENSLVQEIDGFKYQGLDGTNDTLLVFVDPKSPTHLPTQRGNYRLVEGSPAIDKGENKYIEKNEIQMQNLASKMVDTVAEDFVTRYRNAYAELLSIAFANDIDNNPRIINDKVDLGAYEFSSFYVRFETNGGNEVSSLQAAYGETILAPVDPVKDNHRFEGWYKEPEYINKWIFETDSITRDTMLYAKWE